VVTPAHRDVKERVLGVSCLCPIGDWEGGNLEGRQLDPVGAQTDRRAQAGGHALFPTRADPPQQRGSSARRPTELCRRLQATVEHVRLLEETRRAEDESCHRRI